MTKDDEPREKRWRPAGSNSPAPTIFAGNVMVLVAMALLFDDDEGRAELDLGR